MKRRALLGSLSASVVAIAGCNGNTTDPNSGDSDESMPTGKPSSTDTPVKTPVLDKQTPTPDGQTPAERPDGEEVLGFDASGIVDLETTNRSYAFMSSRYRTDDNAEVSLRFTSTATAEHPVTVTATLANKNESTDTFRLDRLPPFGGLVSDAPHPMGEPKNKSTDQAALVFAPTADHDLVESGATVERTDDGQWRLTGESSPEVPDTLRLDPHETVRAECTLVGRVEGTARDQPAGVYDFPNEGEESIRLMVWETGSPGPQSESQFAGTSVPDMPGGREVAWYYNADATTPTFVNPNVEQTDLPATIEFTVVNRSRETTACGHWTVYKLQDGEWFWIGPIFQTLDCRFLQSGEAKTWSFRATTDEMESQESWQPGHLGGGRYAAVVGYGHTTSSSGALVELDAPEISVVPTDDVTTERSNGIITVTSDRWREASNDESRSRRHIILEPADDANQRYIAEQVMSHYRGLRNTLAFVGPNINRVVLRTDNHSLAIPTDLEDGMSFEFEGQAYTITESGPQETD